MTPPKVFISYSWEPPHLREAHKRWVHDFAARLRQDGIDVALDQWHVALGDQLPEFMERSIRDTDYVLVICTPHYRERSHARQGGVGYEGDIITAELLQTRNRRKFIPILRRGDWSDAAPTWLAGSAFVDLSAQPYSETAYWELLSTLLGIKEKAPTIGQGSLAESQIPVSTINGFKKAQQLLSVGPVYYLDESIRNALGLLRTLPLSMVSDRSFVSIVTTAHVALATRRERSTSESLKAWISYWIALCELLTGTQPRVIDEVRAAFRHLIAFLEGIMPSADWDARTQQNISDTRRATNDMSAGGIVTLFYFVSDATKAVMARRKARREVREARVSVLAVSIDELVNHYSLAITLVSPAESLRIAPLLAWSRNCES